MESRFWNQFSTWQQAEAAWDEQAVKAREKFPIIMHSTPKKYPVSEKYLRWNGLKWLLLGKYGWTFFRTLFFRPFTYLWRYVSSLWQSCSNEGDLYLYGISSVDEVMECLQDADTELFVGFSYCQKPLECPYTRFSEKCCADVTNIVCQQCPIAKAIHALPVKRTQYAIIPTVSDMGMHMIQLQKKCKKLFFLVFTCEMALTMFGDFAHACAATGIGIRLHGRTCTTMKAFMLSEQGIKPGRTMVDPLVERSFFSFVHHWRECQNKENACT